MDSLDFQLQKRKKAGSNSASLICQNHYMEYSVTQRNQSELKEELWLYLLYFGWASCKMSFWLRWAQNSLLRRGSLPLGIPNKNINNWQIESARGTIGRGERWEPCFASFTFPSSTARFLSPSPALPTIQSDPCGGERAHKAFVLWINWPPVSTDCPIFNVANRKKPFYWNAAFLPLPNHVS